MYDNVINDRLGEEKNELYVYPVPAKEFINISYFNELDKVELYNLTGSKILEETKINKKRISLNLSNHMKRGVYILKVVTKSGLILNKRLIKD